MLDLMADVCLFVGSCVLVGLGLGLIKATIRDIFNG
jgi:hypothetical protein